MKHYFSRSDGLVFDEASSSCDYPVIIDDCRKGSGLKPSTLYSENIIIYRPYSMNHTQIMMTLENMRIAYFNVRSIIPLDLISNFRKTNGCFL